MSAFLLRHGASTPSSYSTSFPEAETPISQGGRWRGGLTVGLAWNDCNTSIGKAFASTGSMVPGEDSLAILDAGRFAIPADQEVIVTIHKTGGYSPPSSHEVELQLRWGAAPNNFPGYEILIPFSGSPQIVRQNGPFSDYDILTETQLGTWTSPVAHGDVIRAKIVGQTITIYQNGVATTTVTDNSAEKLTSGMPGIGFYCLSGGTPSSYCISSFYCGPAA